MQHSNGFTKLVQEVMPRVTEISADDVAERLEAKEQFVFLDIREESEWAAGRIPGASYLGRGILERDIEKRVPDHDAEIILYCGGGNRSALSADSLQKMGYTNVKSMAGGFRAWTEKGRPVAK